MAIDISNNASRITYSLAQGSSQQAFTASFEFFDDGDISVFVDGVLKEISTHYAVSGGGGATGTVTFGSALTGITGGSKITLLRSTVIERTTDFSSGTDINRAALNTQLDTLTAIAGDNKGRSERALRVPDSENSISVVLPSVADRKGTVLGFHETTGALAVGPNITAVQSLANVTASINRLGTSAAVEDMGILATSAIVQDMALLGTGGNVAAMAKLGVDAVIADMAILGTDAIVADMAILGTDDVVADMAILGTSDVVTDMNLLATAAVVEDMGLLATSVVIEDMGLLATSAVIEDMGLLATSAVIEDMGLLATSAVIEDMGLLASSATVADLALLGTSAVVADLAILATNDVVSDMNTLGTSDVVNDMNVLGTSGNVTAMGLLGTSAVVEDMGLLSASAVIEDMGLLSAAAVIQDMGLLATSAVIEDMGLLATSAVIEDMGLLATSAVIEDIGILGTSANVTAMSNVSGAISNVNTVASNLSGVNAFGARYRVQSGVPSSDNDVGDLVFDTNASTLKVFGASGFQNAGSSVNGTSARFHYDISSAVTSVTGSDASSNTLAYDAGFVDVFVNGVRQSTADVTVTSGDTVTFASALASGDEVDIVAYGTFAVANIVATGALNTGTITAGFGNINNGASTITTTGVGSFGSLDVEGAIDVNGTTNLDAVDIDGAVQIDATLSVGVNDTGYDVKFFGDTASAFMQWDASTDDLILGGAAQLGIGTSPACNFHIKGDNPRLRVEGDDNTVKFDVFMDDANPVVGTSTNHDLVFMTNDSEKMRINAAGKAMIGTSTEGQNQADNFTVSDAGNMGMTLRSTNSGECSIFFSDATSGAGEFAGSLQYIHSDNSMRFATNGAEKVRIQSAGQVLIGTSTTDMAASDGSGVAINENGGIQMMDSRTSATSNTFRMRFFNGDDNAAKGAIRTNGDATAFDTSSDYRLKENVVYDWDATTRLKQLKPCRFNWISDDTNTAIDGFLAHEAATVVPNAVSGEKDATEVWENCVVNTTGQTAARNVTEEEWTAGKLTTEDEDGNTVAAKYASNTTWTANYTTKLMQGIDHSFLVPLLVKTIQELEARITALEA